MKALLDGEIVGTFDSAGSYSFRDVGIGPHDLTAQAVRLDGTPYGEPNSEASISVVVTSPCESDADCNDNNECTEERCLDGGTCSYSVIPDCENTTPPGAECKTNADCADKVDGLGVCKQPYCDIENDFVCIVVPSPEGTNCDDGDACTEETQCAEGECTGGTDADCNDDNPCTEDTCDPLEGCSSSVLKDTPCDDGDACTEEGTCSGGECIAEAKNCDDGEFCTCLLYTSPSPRD